MNNEHAVLIDGSGYIYRAFYGLPPFQRASDGMHVGAILGFSQMLFSLVTRTREDLKPTHLAVVLDHKGPTFRHEFFPEYKANRPSKPEELAVQLDMIRTATRAFGVPVIEMPRYEADDLLATYARIFTDRGGLTSIVSGDKDLMQLMSPQVQLFEPVKNTMLLTQDVIDKFGVVPDLVCDVQALMGDTVDNVPGVPGIGVKTASNLILDFGSLEMLLQNAGDVEKVKTSQKLVEFAEQARLSYRLVTLDRQVPVDPYSIEEIEVRDPDMEVLTTFLAEMEFETLLEKVRAAA